LIKFRKTVYVERERDTGVKHSDHVLINENSTLDNINLILWSCYFRN